MKQLIEQCIKNRLKSSAKPYYREPLIGYADASDPIFLQLKDIVGPGHLLPRDLLPDAKAVMAFFLPFTEELVMGNRPGKLASRDWAEAYIYTNQLITEICDDLIRMLGKQGVHAATQPPTYVFDTKLLIANWSHKHIAYACGLGSFGCNYLLITSQGCAGRFGSLVLDAELEPDLREKPVRSCLRDQNGCNYCRKICPVEALSDQGFKRQECYAQCIINDQYYSDLDSCEVCGKCATGPCGVKKVPVKTVF